MAQEFFDPVLFIKEDAPASVDLSQTPFFCNIHGFPHYCAEPPTGLKLLEPATSDPEAVIGNAYRVLSATTTHPDPKYGNQTRLEFLADQVEYEALAVTHQIVLLNCKPCHRPRSHHRPDVPGRSVADDTERPRFWEGRKAFRSRSCTLDSQPS
jgi:hypothetical protein